MTDPFPDSQPHQQVSQPDLRRPRNVQIPLILLAVLMLAALPILRSGRGGPALPEGVVNGVINGDLQLKYAYTYRGIQKATPADKFFSSAMTAYSGSADLGSNRALFRLAVLEGVNNPRRAARTIERVASPSVMKYVPEGQKGLLRRQAVDMKSLYSTARPLNAIESARYIKLTEDLQLGPSVYLARERVYKLSGMPKLAAQQRELAYSRYRTDCAAILEITVLGFTALAVGLIILLVMVISPGKTAATLRLTERHDEEAALAPSLWLSFAGYMAVFLVVSIVAAIAVKRIPDSLPRTRLADYSIFVMVGASVLTGAIALLGMRCLLRRTHSGLEAIGLRTENAIRSTGWGIVGYTVALPLFGAGVYATVVIKNLLPHMTTPANPVVPMLLSAGSPWSIFALFLLGSVVAPVVEESFFRGALFRALRCSFGVWPAILVSALAFASVHPFPAGFLPIFALGVVFAVLAQARNSLLPSMIAHGIHNSAIFLFVIFATRA